MSGHSMVRALATLCTCVLATAASASPRDVTAVPPATYVAPRAEKAAAAPRPLITGARHTVALAAPTAAEKKALVDANRTAKRKDAKSGPLVIGIGRELGALERNVAASDLHWVAVPDGGQAARIDVTSSGAVAVRLALVMVATHPDITVRFAGSADPGTIFGPYPANQVAEVAAAEGAFWTPVLDGETGTIELHAPPGVPVRDVSLAVVRLSHLAASAASVRRMDAKTATDIGTSGPCEIDVACVANAAVANTAKSVAELVLTTVDGRTLECTGTLVNDSTVTFTPYLYSASHCIESQTAASTLNTYWFFDAVACGAKSVPPYVLRTGGATLLGRSEDYDWALVRLRETPPDGAQFSAWRAETLLPGTQANTAHHPEGDLKKWSQGISKGYFTYPDASTFIEMLWTQGSTEPGSSGAGLFTFLPSGGYYELRGGLYGGEAACGNPSGSDRFSRLDKALPLLRQYLTPNVPNPNGEVVVVEFYNRQLDHYFISSNPAEINDLDTGVHPGWERTGLRFLAYGDPAQAPTSATPVCRFYLNPNVGDSHFYSGDPAECAATQDKFGASWTYESPSVFWIVLPDRASGECPSGMNPVYRFFNTVRTNHRYTMEEDVRFDLSSTPGWIPEGYGAKATIMCSPSN